MPRLLGLLLPAFAATALAFSTSTVSAADVQPIEGTWNLQGGQVTVTANSDGTFTGTVSKKIGFSQCPHDVGEKIWDISGSGASYSGTHQYNFAAGDNCSVGQQGKATWTISEDESAFTLHFCTNKPGEPAPTDGNAYYCGDLTRAKPPAGTVASAASSQTPSGGEVLVTGDSQTARELSTGGCISRSARQRTFSVTAAKLVPRKKGAPKSRSQPHVVRLTKQLDGHQLGRKQFKAPFNITLVTSALKPGTHVLRVTAKVTLRHGGKLRTRRLLLPFSVCGA